MLNILYLEEQFFKGKQLSEFILRPETAVNASKCLIISVFWVSRNLPNCYEHPNSEQTPELANECAFVYHEQCQKALSKGQY